MLILCLFAIGGCLVSMQNGCYKFEEEQAKPSMLQLEAMLDEENRKLDEEIGHWFEDRSEPCEPIPIKHRVTPEIEARFRALEEEVRNAH